MKYNWDGRFESGLSVVRYGLLNGGMLRFFKGSRFASLHDSNRKRIASVADVTGLSFVPLGVETYQKKDGLVIPIPFFPHIRIVLYVENTRHEQANND